MELQQYDSPPSEYFEIVFFLQICAMHWSTKKTLKVVRASSDCCSKGQTFWQSKARSLGLMVNPAMVWRVLDCLFILWIVYTETVLRCFYVNIWISLP